MADIVYPPVIKAALGLFKALDLTFHLEGTEHVPARAVAALKAGEVVGVFAEATISRSFTVKDIKNGAVRMAAAAGVPMIPTALWGTQRLWTKGRPRRLTQRHVPVTILVGEPMRPAAADDITAVTAELRKRMADLVEKAQREYPELPKPGEGWWQPAYLGGTAPTPEEAAKLG